MAKLAVRLATLALLLFLANASIRTTVTVDEDGNPWGRQEGSCQQQIMRQNYLKHCQMYMEEQCSGGRCHYNRRGSSQHLDSCCQQLEKLDMQCRYPGLKQAMMQQMGRSEEMQEMQEMSEEILSKCNMEPRKCGMPFHTTITLNSEENPSRGPTQGCSQQIKQQDYLGHCQKYMEAQCSCSGCKGCDCGCKNRSNTRHLESCCEQLQNLDRQCRCPGLKQAIQQQMEQGQMEREEMQEMYQMADRIMSKCNMEPRKCNMQRGLF